MKTRKRVQKSFKGTISRTKQAFKDECDINKILSKYHKTQLLQHVNTHQGSYGDFSHATDYQTALNAVMDAQNSFMELPASLRKHFNNDPSQFVSFVSDEKNRAQAQELGLIPKPKPDPNLETPPTGI